MQNDGVEWNATNQHKDIPSAQIWDMMGNYGYTLYCVCVCIYACKHASMQTCEHVYEDGIRSKKMQKQWFYHFTIFTGILRRSFWSLQIQEVLFGAIGYDTNLFGDHIFPIKKGLSGSIPWDKATAPWITIDHPMVFGDSSLFIAISNYHI